MEAVQKDDEQLATEIHDRVGDAIDVVYAFQKETTDFIRKAALKHIHERLYEAMEAASELVERTKAAK